MYSDLHSIFRGGRLPRLLYTTRQSPSAHIIARPMHQHKRCCELLLVYEGAGFYVMDGHSYQIGPGDVLFYNQGSMHEVVAANREIGTYCFGISDVFLVNHSDGHLSTSEEGFVRPSNELFEDMRAICSLIYQTMEDKSPLGRETAHHLFVALVIMAVRLPPDERCLGIAPHAVLATRVRRYIHAHFTEGLTLDKMATALNASPYYVAHVFKDVTGFSPMHYIIRCRIGQAQNLLISSDYSATEIAYMVGYNSAGHFSSMFASLVGQTPIQYRNQYIDQLRGERRQ